MDIVDLEIDPAVARHLVVDTRRTTCGIRSHPYIPRHAQRAWIVSRRGTLRIRSSEDILLAIADRMGVPVRFIGIGEAAEDMQPFVAEDFADALLSR